MEQSALVLIFDSRGNLALQKRSAADDSYPSRWDFSAGGGVDAGETHQAAAVRELKEELGVEIPVTLAIEMDYPGTGNNDAEHVAIFRAIHDGPFSPDPKEVEEVRFFSIPEVYLMMQTQREKFHPELVFFLEGHQNFFSNP